MDRLLIALERVRKDFPHYGPAVDAVKLIEKIEIKTAGIDEFCRIYYNPIFMDGLKDPEVKAVMRHELEHYIRKHHFRFLSLVNLGVLTRDEKGMKKFNIAADLEENCDIDELPPMALHPKRFKFPVGLTLEEYLPLITPAQFDYEDGGGKGTEPPDIIIGGEDLEEAERVNEEIVEKIGKLWGTQPGSGYEAVKYTKIRYNWKSVLRNAISRITTDKIFGADLETYARINRKMSSVPKVIFPKKYSEQRIIRILFAIDSSASMWNVFNKIFSFLRSLVRMYESEDTVFIVSLMQVDTQVHEFVPVVDMNTLPKYIRGFGGTNMRRVHDYIKDNDLDFDLVIIGTDGGTPWYHDDPPMHNRTVVLLTEDIPEDRMPPYRTYRV